MSEKEQLVQAMKDGDLDTAMRLAERVVVEKTSAVEVVGALIQGIREIGDAFERFDIFLPEMMMASNAMIEVLKIFEPKLKTESPEAKTVSGKIIMATVKGDMHEIGKNIVVTLLKANRFDVIDLGADVDSLEIVKAAQRENAEVIGLSALMTTTMLGQKEVVDILNDMKIRDQFKIIVGGAPTTQEWATRIGADGWAKDASTAVDIAEALIPRKGVK